MAPTPFAAVNVRLNVPPELAAPDKVPVPSPLSTNATPAGKLPVSVRDGTGLPVVVTVKLPEVPAVKVVLFPLVIAGAALTVRVKF